MLLPCYQQMMQEDVARHCIVAIDARRGELYQILMRRSPCYDDGSYPEALKIIAKKVSRSNIGSGFQILPCSCRCCVMSGNALLASGWVDCRLGRRQDVPPKVHRRQSLCICARPMQLFPMLPAF